VAESPEEGNYDDVFSSLSIHDMIALMRGRDGRDGKDGTAGLNGRDGRDGLQGEKGETGDPGIQGPRGQPGAAAPGEKGNPGSRGLQGVAGEPGERGSPGSPGLSVEAGSVYTRWGRQSCPVNASLVYHGFAAANHYDSTGGGTNYQCLPLDPEYNLYSSSGRRSIISGAEYQSHDYGIFPNAAHDQNVPCARCYSSRSAMMMLPAKRTCPLSWNKEYEGYLMASYTGHKHQSTYECVDQHPEYISGHAGDSNGALFYFVSPDCSSAGTVGHCPPYNTGKQLTCVVCTK